MAAPNINTYSNKYKFGRGRLLFNPLVAAVYQGFRPFGNTPGFNVNVESEQYEHFSSEGGIGEKDLQVPLSINRTATIDCDNISNANLALFLAGEEVTITQASTPIVAEVLSSVKADRIYQLGATTTNPAGVRVVSAVVARIQQGAQAAARANSTAYVVGNIYRPAAANLHWYVCTVAGTSAAAPPTFTTDGTTFADGTATFKNMGLIIVASTADVNYRLDLPLGLLSVTPAGTIATANTAYAAIVTSGVLSLEVDYTPAANTRQQVRTTGSAELQGQLKFLADNPYGDNQDAFFPDVTLSPSGELPFITEDAVASMQFAVGINVLNSSTKAMYIDGRPA